MSDLKVEKTLASFKAKLDKEIEKYFDIVIKETVQRDALMADAVKYVKQTVLAGGKRLRPAFMYYGYLAAGGEEKEKILRTSVSIELVHTFLLIHDDIIDRDKKRHGMDTVNFRYEKIGKKFFKKNDFEHFGNSMALIIGDMIGALGNQIIFDSQFEAKDIMRALSKLQSIISLTVIGQAQDIYIGYRNRAREDQVLEMYGNKTAKYTIEGPLQLGAILGGADREIMDGLSSYALPLGIAFQIQDDILGIFGSEKKIGKRVGADIAEGKQTLLIVKAKEKAGPPQKKKLENILGKKDLTAQNISDFRKVIKDTGALDYARAMAQRLVAEAKEAAEKLNIRAEAKEFLVGVADYMANREI